MICTGLGRSAILPNKSDVTQSRHCLHRVTSHGQLLSFLGLRLRLGVIVYIISPKMLSTDTVSPIGASFLLTTKIMNVDEESQETPLLAENAGKKQATPLPWSQLIIVMFLQLAEPLTSHAISPFTPEVYSLILLRMLINESQSSFVILSPTVTRAKWDIMSVSWCVDYASCRNLLG